MQPRSLFVALILAVAGLSGLAAYQGYLLHSLQSPAQAVGSVRSTANKDNAVAGHVSDPTPSPRLEVDSGGAYSPSNAFHWRSVETPDYRSYVENLHAIGCPEQTVRDIVISDVNRLYASRRAALLMQGKVPRFWQPMEPVAEEKSVERMQQLAALEKEKSETVRSLLAIDPATEERKNREGVTYPENRLGNLPPEKQDQVSFVREEFNEKWNRLSAGVHQPGSSEDEVSAELRRLNEDRLTKLAQILTPEELQEHELQTSWTAIQLRDQLSAFQPTEAEFLKIYELQKAFDDEYVHYFHGRTDEVAVAQKTKAQQELAGQLQVTLGSQRYAEYLRARSGERP